MLPPQEEREEARRLYGNAVSTSVVTNRRLKQKERDAKLSAAAAVVIPGARAGSIPVSASAPDPGALEFDARMREKREKVAAHFFFRFALIKKIHIHTEHT